MAGTGTNLQSRSFLSGFLSNLKDLTSKPRSFLRGFGSGPPGAKNIPLLSGCTMAGRDRATEAVTG